MKRWSSLQRPAVALIVASLAGLAAVPMDWPYRVILALLGLLGLLGWRRSVQEQGKHREAAENNRLIKAMNEYRHDWMNDFQVLFGYIRLKKYDKLLDYMDKINADAYRESYVSKLGLPSLIVYFYSYRTDKKAMELEIEIEREIVLTKLPLDSEKAGELIRRTVELFRENAVEGEPNVLSLAFDLEEDGLLLDFVYTGVMDKANLQQGLEGLKDSYPDGTRLEHNEEDEGAAVTIRLPFHNQ